MVGLGLVYLFGSCCYVGKLPKADLETVVGKMPDKLFRIGEARRVELPLTEPVSAKPSSVQVDNITGIVLVAQTLADAIHLFG